MPASSDPARLALELAAFGWHILPLSVASKCPLANCGTAVPAAIPPPTRLPAAAPAWPPDDGATAPADVRRLFNRLNMWIVRRIWGWRFKRWRNAGLRTLPETRLYGECAWSTFCN